MQEREGKSSIFPDKKTSSTDYESTMRQLRQTQEFKHEASISQEQATWILHGEYPQLPHAITWMSDIHFGSLNCDYDALENDLNTIASTPNMFVIFGGDMIDNFSPTKYPDGMMSDGINPQEQILAWMEVMRSLDQHSKIGGIVWGNHEAFSKVAGFDIFNTFLRDMQAPVFSDKGGGVLTVVMEGATYRLGVRHTHWGNSKLNITNASKRMIQFGYPDLDVAMLGHTHTAGAEIFTQAGQEKLAINGGTYKVDDSFGKQWGNEPMMGGITLTLDPMTKKLGVFRRPDQAQAYVLGNIAKAQKEGYIDPYTELQKKLKKKR